MAEEVKYLIIGGGIAGTACAETIREYDQDGRVVIVSDEPHPLYSRVLLTKPNFFMEKIPFDKIWLKDKGWYGEHSIELIAGRSAERLDSRSKIVILDNGRSLRYEKLMLGIGSRARKLEVPGAEKQGVYYLRTIEDTRRIIAAVKRSRKGVVVGGGIIGFEISEMLELAGLDTAFIMREQHYREPILGYEYSEIIDERIRERGVRVVCGSEVTEILGNDKVSGVRLNDGQELPCQILIIGIGSFVPAGWLKEAGLEINTGIVANEYLETNLPYIWTAGDSAEFYDVIIGERVVYGNWSNAQKQGARAALNMLGKRAPFEAVTFFQTNAFGVTMTYIGNVLPISASSRGGSGESRNIIQRGGKDDDIKERLFLKNNRLVGAVLINAPQNMRVYSKIIESQMDLSGKKEQLCNPHYNIENIIKWN